MMSVIHPAKTMPFEDLMDGMEASRTAGMVSRREDRATGRVLYCYTNRCVYEGGWDTFALLARGLIVHPGRREVVATPFPKFFNAGERGAPIPDLPFETFEKLDGSLAIIHHFDGQWHAATKGAFDSSQAVWTEQRLQRQDTSAMEIGATYLAEAIYPENRIVVHYATASLVLLAAYHPDGAEFTRAEIEATAARLKWRAAKRHSFASFSALVAHTKTLSAQEEGFVLRFADGLRLKVKGEEYRRIHALISRCTPLAMWEAMMAGSNMEAIRRDLPEEFWGDFDAIIATLNAQIEHVTAGVVAAAATVADLSDKALGLRLGEFGPDVRPFLFPYRKSGRIEGKTLQTMFRGVRPTGNNLPGYVPSYAMGRVLDEAP